MEDNVVVSVVIPVYNEQLNLDDLVTRCLSACNKTDKTYEIILIDDGSTDKSTEKIKKYASVYENKVVGVLLNRNYGQHAAIMAGFDVVRGDIVITLDADLQNPPEEIPRLVDEIEKGFDVVGTVRTHRKDSLFRKFSSLLINKGVQKATGVEMHDYGCMLRAYKKHIVDAMRSCKESSTFIPVLANSFAKNTTEIYVSHAKRELGDSKYKFWQLISLQYDLLTSMTTFPLRLLNIIGAIISVLGFSLGISIIFLRLYFGAAWAVEGVFTLFAILFIFIGAQFIGMGLLGEYIGRIYNDVRGRPKYFVQEIVGRKKDKN